MDLNNNVYKLIKFLQNQNKVGQNEFLNEYVNIKNLKQSRNFFNKNKDFNVLIKQIISKDKIEVLKNRCNKENNKMRITNRFNKVFIVYTLNKINKKCYEIPYAVEIYLDDNNNFKIMNYIFSENNYIFFNKFTDFIELENTLKEVKINKKISI